MEGTTNFSRCLKQFDGLTWLTLTLVFYDRSIPVRLHRRAQSRTAWRELVKISNVDDKMSSVDDDYDDGMGPERLRTAVDWRDRI